MLRGYIPDGKPIHLGHCVLYDPIYASRFDRSRLVGLVLRHAPLDGAAGDFCEMRIFFDQHYVSGTARVYPLRSEYPLTVTGQIPCPRCGRSGWIRDGAWVPARRL